MAPAAAFDLIVPVQCVLVTEGHTVGYQFAWGWIAATEDVISLRQLENASFDTAIDDGRCGIA